MCDEIENCDQYSRGKSDNTSKATDVYMLGLTNFE